MNGFLILAQDAIRFTEWSWPQNATEWLVISVIIGGLIAWSIELYRRDSAELSTPFRILLPTLRLLAIVGLLIVFLNPRTRTQTWADRPSRVAVLVDVSSSMLNPAEDPAEESVSAENVPSRFQRVVELIEDSSWLNELREKHEVSIYSFNGTVSNRLATLPPREDGSESSDEPTSEPVIWEEALQPKGNETRLGEVTAQIARELNGRTLAGVIVVSDGGNNAGIDVASANDVARTLQVRVVALGTGGTKAPINLELVKVVSPSDVQLGDPFDIEAYVRAEGLAGQQVKVELLTREPGTETAFYPLAEQTTTLLEDVTPVQVTFPVTPTLEGEWEYQVKTTPVRKVREVKEADNVRVTAVNAFERPVKVLVFAGGPSWDYRFLTGVLKRHPGFTIDACLQSGTDGISQDVDNLLYQFPTERAELFEYDVVVCFDPNWMDVPEESRRLFEEWVGNQGGGVVFIAGDINTPLLASSRDELGMIMDLHPVFLDTILPGIDLISASTQVRPLNLTEEGRTAPLLNIDEDAANAATFWEDFAGFYRFYPTAGAKTGATVYATAGGVGDLTESEPPIFLASQFYGQGRTFYVGSPEFYRLRAEDPEFFERFWTRIGREAAQNRLRRSNPRGTLLVDQQTVRLGEMIKVRARLLDANFEPLQVEGVDIEVERPDGRLLSPAPRLRPDASYAGSYVGEIRAQNAGRYQVRLRIPGTEDAVRESVVAELPDLENRDLRQDVRQLQMLTAGTGGGYFPLSEADSVLSLLPQASEQFLLGEQIRTLWDRGWLMYLIVGLFGLEWLIRKLLQLA